jgi:hypothetical protein
LSKAGGVPVKTAAASRQNRRLAQKDWCVRHIAAETVRRYCEPSTKQLSKQTNSQLLRG